ncbi:unnamed protein product [Tuber aestivum]|uniref:S-adenosyl-L-methionine-dependent methyltransferase n=1 Tax=Tuber aestivum TaxID=59557 RepID=A0A292PV22_9PEZI|nr:unnamed protein product [Tuber aestivum]
MSGQPMDREPLPPLDCMNIEVDSGMDYHESDEDQVPSGCVSITSSVVDYQYEHGRRYHSYSQGNYPMPNDETEQDRLDMHHQIFLKMLDGKLFLAPLDRNPPKRILDIGTGTGIWALDMAEPYHTRHFPHAHVIGTDLSPIQPTMVLPNCRFEVDDAELGWTWPPNHFDFIHSRLLGQSIKNWERFLEQIFHHLKPGGYIELIEHLMDVRSDDGSYPPGCALRVYMHNLNLSLEQMGVPNIATRLKEFVIKAGFVEVREEVRNMPWGPWPKDPRMKEIGYWALLNSDTSFEAYGLALFTRVLGMTGEEARELCTRAQRDLKNKHIHVYNPKYASSFPPGRLVEALEC